MSARITLELQDETEAGFQSLAKSIDKAKDSVEGVDAATKQADNTLKKMVANLEESTKAQIDQSRRLSEIRKISSQQDVSAAIADERKKLDELVNTAGVEEKLVRESIARYKALEKQKVRLTQQEEKEQAALKKTAALQAETAQVEAARAAAAKESSVSQATAKQAANLTEKYKQQKQSLVNLQQVGNQWAPTLGGMGGSMAKLAVPIGLAIAGLKGLQLGLSATGKSADGTIDNWVRLKREAAELGKSSLEVGKQILGIDRAMKFVSESTHPLIQNFRKLGEAVSQTWKGNDFQIRREAEKAFRNEVKASIETEKELGKVSQLISRESIEAALQKERMTRLAKEKTAEWTEAAAKRSFEVEKSLMLRLVEVSREAETRRAEEARKIQETHLAWIARKEKADSERRKALWEEERAFQSEIRDGNASERVSVQNRNIELMKSRISREKIDERAKIEAIAELEKTAILNRAAVEHDHAKDRIERAKIEARTLGELADLELQKRIDVEEATARIQAEARKKALADAREKFRAEVDLLKNKLMEEKRLREGGPSQSEYQKLAGSFDSERVREEIVANRLQAGARSGRDGKGRKLTEAEIRRMVIREMRGGQLDQKEIQAAQIDLVQQTAVQGAKTGKLGKTTAKAFHEIATSIKQQNATAEQLGEEIQQITKFIKGDTDASQRRQAQRRGSRR